MAFVPVTNVVKYDFMQTWQGQQVMNSLYVERPGGWDATQITDQASALETWFKTNILAGFAQSLALNSIVATDLTAQNGLGLEFSIGGTNIGGEAQASVPNNVSLCVKFITLQRGRSFRGRWYLAGLLAMRVTDNRVTQAFAQEMVTAFGTLLTGGILAGNSLSVVSRVGGGAPRATGLITPVTGFGCEIFIDSQRRRLPGRGA